MFYEIKVRSFIRVPPDSFTVKTEDAVLKNLIENYENYVNKDYGFVIGVIKVIDIGDGIIIPGDGAAYYDTTFSLLIFKPELHELAYGSVSEITEFGAFVDIGASEAMVHISQTMDDYVSFNKSGTLVGKESKKVLKAKDKCKVRIITVSFKEIENPRIGLTMRQPLLGSLNWQVNEKKKQSESRK